MWNGCSTFACSRKNVLQRKSCFSNTPKKTCKFDFSFHIVLNWPFIQVEHFWLRASLLDFPKKLLKFNIETTQICNQCISKAIVTKVLK